MILRGLLQHGGAAINFIQRRQASIVNSLKSSPVLISSNKDIYTNLALEHLLYNDLKFEDPSKKEIRADNGSFKKPVVLIWTDEPCIVIGRHQNPWIESSLGLINKKGIKLARRHSGGGCVYHDENNLNISIIGHRNNFENRRANLDFLAQFLDSKYGIKCKSTQRHDLVHSDTGLKLTGSAAKLGRFNSYHHFTLLVDTDKEALYSSIRQNPQEFISTNSSLSTRSKVINLKEIKPNLEIGQLVSDLAIAYGELYKDPDAVLPAKKDREEGDRDEMERLMVHRDKLLSWDWIYGMTPRFKMERVLPLIDAGVQKQVKLTVSVNKGMFESIDIDTDLKSSTSTEVFQSLIGTKFSYKESMVNVANLLKGSEDDVDNIAMGIEKVFGMLILQMIHEAHQ